MELTKADARIASLMKRDEPGTRRERRRDARERYLAAAQEELPKAVSRCNVADEEWCQCEELRMGKLKQAFDTEVGELEQQWGDPASLKRFSKPSPRLLGLRTTERRLAVMRMFERAKRIRDEAERTEREEAAEAERRAIAAMRTRYENLAEAQRRRKDGFLEWAKRHRETNRRLRETVVEPIEQALVRWSASTPLEAERRVDCGWIDDEWPVSPRRVSNAVDANTARRAEPLPLSGIKLREHVKIRKVDFRSESQKRKKNKNLKKKTDTAS
jgi:hypothetical protein